MKHPRDFWLYDHSNGNIEAYPVEQDTSMIRAPDPIHVREVLPLEDQIKPTCSEVHRTDSEIITNQAKEIERLRTRIEGMILSFNKHGANIDVGFHVKWLSEVLNK